MKLKTHLSLSIFIMLFYGTALSQLNLNQGLVGYWPLNGNATDQSGNGLNASSVQAALTTDRKGQFNKAYYFNGVSSYIQIPHSSLYEFEPTGQFSLSFWAQPSVNMTSGVQAMVVKAPFNANVGSSAWNYGAYLQNSRVMTGWHGNAVLLSSSNLEMERCWSNIIIIYNNGRWRIYINGMIDAVDNSQTQFILKDGTSPIAFGRKGLTNGDWYKGKLDDIRLYNRVLSNDEILALSSEDSSCLYNNPPVCGEWTSNPANISQTDIILSQNDTILCGDASIKLRSSSLESFCWSPIDYLNDPSLLSPTANPPSDITYFLTTKQLGNNIIVNGNFDLGNTGFTSQYQYSSNGLEPGRYYIANSPNPWHPTMPPCKDHTTGTGNMMLVNGANVPGVTVWSQNVSVVPGTVYEFSGWLTNISSDNFNLCQLKLYVNNVPISDVITSFSNSCSWKSFSASWHSDTNSMATISIINESTFFTGNDFALDDLSFSSVRYLQDSIRIFRNKNCIVPLSITRFEVESFLQNLNLKFEIANNGEVAFVNIERSYNGINFNRIASFNANNTGVYGYQDQSLNGLNNIVYYRINATSKSGEVYYSGIRYLKFSNQNQFSLIKSVFQKGEVIKVSSREANAIAIVRLVDPSGRLVANKGVQFINGEIFLNQFTGYKSSGIYFMSISSGSVTETFKLLIQ